MSRLRAARRVSGPVLRREHGARGPYAGPAAVLLRAVDRASGGATAVRPAPSTVPHRLHRVSVLAIILIVVAVLALVLFIGGLVYSRRRLNDPALERHIRAADQELEQARASDRGWDRLLLEEAARRTLAEERPGFGVERLHLVLVDDRPGVEEDRAHMLAMGDDGEARVVLTRNAEGEWIRDHVE
jgi:hypothetical protein